MESSIVLLPISKGKKVQEMLPRAKLKSKRKWKTVLRLNLCHQPSSQELWCYKREQKSKQNKRRKRCYHQWEVDNLWAKVLMIFKIQLNWSLSHKVLPWLTRWTQASFKMHSLESVWEILYLETLLQLTLMHKLEATSALTLLIKLRKEFSLEFKKSMKAPLKEKM